MNERAWRICPRQHVKKAFSGEGARLYGGRWNSKGTSVIYVASSVALAALEMLVHLDFDDVVSEYVYIPVAYEPSLAAALDKNDLPRNWRGNPAPPSARQIGDVWVREKRSALLVVPSAVIPCENNLLINPAHPDFAKLEIGAPTPFQLDSRLMKKPS